MTSTSTRAAPKEADQPAGNASAKASESLSGFVAKVVDQLSVTAWLPAVVLVGNASLLLALSTQGELSLPAAVEALAAMRWGAIVVGLFAITIAAVVLQAFEFEILRFFEGYHRSPAMARRAVRRIDKHVERREALETEVRERQVAAFEAARLKALGAGDVQAEDQAAWATLEKVIRGWSLTDDDRSALGRASDLDWPRFSTAILLHNWDVAQLQLAEYPNSHRVLPTRLGNAMRAAEDEVELTEDEDLEGFIIRNYDRLPQTVTDEHDAYRSRLEMYLALVVTSILLSILSAACLWHSTGSVVSVSWRVAIPMTYVVASFLCYRAAIASALGFGVALREATAWVSAHAVETTIDAA